MRGLQCQGPRYARPVIATPRVGRLTALVVMTALGATMGLASPGSAQSAGADPNAPQPLLPSNTGTGTLNPALGETDPPPPGAILRQGGNPPLGQPREVGPPPGGTGAAATASGGQGGHLPNPAAPPPPGGAATQGAAPATPQPYAAPSAVSTPPTMVQGSRAPADAETLAKARAAVAEATATVRELRNDSGFQTDVSNLLARARAVAVVPSFFRAGFFVGGAYGSTLLLVRDPNGAFSHPAFFTMSAGSLGLQFGIQDARIMLLIMTDDGLNAILQDQFKLEANANVTFGIVGGGISTGSTTDINQDIIAVSHSRGLFGGGALEGALIEPRQDWNAIFYESPGIRPEQIVLQRQVGNPAAIPLIEALQAPYPLPQ